VQAYLHNGVFKSLHEVVDFYNTRDVGDWPPPEVPENVNSDELGDLGLSDQDVDDIVAFLNTLTDGYMDEPLVPTYNLSQPVLSSVIQSNISPNPFNTTTEIRLDLMKAADVRLNIYDLNGRLVKSLMQGERAHAGIQTVTWDGTDNSGKPVSTGIYFYDLSAGQDRQVERMVLLR
jgi:hypothetical protein